jgi:hypothetical protein
MQNRQAIISFSQSEKVKSALIWCSTCAHLAENLPEPQRQGAVRVLQSLVAMVANEVQLARQASGEPIWTEVEKILNTARVMIDSGVSQEAEYHLTQALTQVNRVGQKSLTHLIEQGLMA